MNTIDVKFSDLTKPRFKALTLDLQDVLENFHELKDLYQFEKVGANRQDLLNDYHDRMIDEALRFAMLLIVLKKSPIPLIGQSGLKEKRENYLLEMISYVPFMSKALRQITEDFKDG